jgi:hypothetical protein
VCCSVEFKAIEGQRVWVLRNWCDCLASLMTMHCRYNDTAAV